MAVNSGDVAMPLASVETVTEETAPGNVPRAPLPLGFTVKVIWLPEISLPSVFTINGWGNVRVVATDELEFGASTERRRGSLGLTLRLNVTELKDWAEAVAAKLPPVPFDLSAGAVAAPSVPVATTTLLPPPVKVPDAPVAGVEKVIGTPGSG